MFIAFNDGYLKLCNNILSNLL